MSGTDLEDVVREVTQLLASRLESMFDGEEPEDDHRSRGRNHRRREEPSSRTQDGRAFNVAESRLHKINKKVICETDSRGYPTPKNISPTELLLHTREGFIPLWSNGVTLQWKFNDVSMSFFSDAEEKKEEVRELLTEAIEAWGDAAPVRFREKMPTISRS